MNPVPTGIAMATEDGGWASVTTFYSCILTHYWTYVPAMGEYVHTWTDSDCRFWQAVSGETGACPGTGDGVGGTWSGTTGDPPSEIDVGDEACDQIIRVGPDSAVVNAKCLLTLESKDSTLLRRVMDSTALGHLRPLSTIADSSVRVYCEQAHEAWRWAFSRSQPVVYRGATTDTTSAGGPTHDAQGTFNMFIHFDPHVLDDTSPEGMRILTELAWHEAVHYYYNPDPGTHSHVYPYTGEPWFEAIHDRVNGCTK